MTRLIRFRFSLATLLIAMAWSGVAVWMNVTPRFRGFLTPISAITGSHLSLGALLGQRITGGR